MCDHPEKLDKELADIIKHLIYILHNGDANDPEEELRDEVATQIKRLMKFAETLHEEHEHHKTPVVDDKCEFCGCDCISCTCMENKGACKECGCIEPDDILDV